MLHYHLLDVFTDTSFAGNQLAVFVDPPELSAGQMQAVARELNLSETVFVRPDRDGDAWPTRIFTPHVELPFAGHPTVGTGVLLAELGLVDGSVTLAEGVGDVAVEVCKSSPDEPAHATLTAAKLPERLDAPDHTIVAECLGLDPADLHSRWGPSGWSCGIPFLVVPVRDVDALSRVSVDQGVWFREVSGRGLDGLYPIAPLDDSFASWRARMFGLDLGVVEDPATGSAAAAVAGFLSSTVPTGGRHRWQIEQGVEMGRPSRLDVEAVLDGGELRAVRVGGHAVVVGSGTLRAPAASV